MNRLQQFLVCIAMAFALSACGESGSDSVSSGGATLDVSSDAAMEASIAAMTDDMSNDEKGRFGQALAGIMMIRGISMMGEDLSEEEMHARMMEGLGGLTADEIVAKANEIKAEMEAQ